MQQGNPPDPTVLAEIHWFTNAIENRAVQAYLGDHSRHDKLIAVLRTAYRTLALNGFMADNPDCPWPPCWTGECTPECPPRPIKDVE